MSKGLIQVSTFPQQCKKLKPNITVGDLNDVTLGSSAIFQSLNPREASKIENLGQKQL